jgi:hypothetical protein
LDALVDNHFSANDYHDEDSQRASCIALTQNHRGHGQSTLAWYLARALVATGLRVLIVDITGRHERLHALVASENVKNVGIWTPAEPRSAQIPAILQTARQQTRGHIDVILLDSDAAPLESTGGFAASIDYVLALVDPTETGQKSADQLAERLGDPLPPHSHFGVVFSRVNAVEASRLPSQTMDRRLPVIGYFPADYLLAGDDDSQRRGSQPIIPHDTYLQAIQQLSRTLIPLAQLRRIPSPATTDDNHQPPDDGHDEP